MVYRVRVVAVAVAVGLTFRGFRGSGLGHEASASVASPSSVKLSPTHSAHMYTPIHPPEHCGCEFENGGNLGVLWGVHTLVQGLYCGCTLFLAWGPWGSQPVALGREDGVGGTQYGGPVRYNRK